VQPPEPPEAPEYLTGYGSDEWHRIAGELHRLRLLTILDVHVLGAYCESYRVWRTAAEVLSAMAARDPVTAGLLVKSQSGTAMQNPLFLTMRQAANDMLRFAGELGCTPIARARLAAGPFGEPPGAGKFGDLIS
jgi:P27 family predicted phage terminase small subunit